MLRWTLPFLCPALAILGIALTVRALASRLDPAPKLAVVLSVAATLPSTAFWIEALLRRPSPEH
jgi:hypothetical protein